MTLCAAILIIIALALRTRLGRLQLAVWLLGLGNALGDAGARILDAVQRETRR